MRKKKMLFIYNPCAGKGAMKSKLSDVMETFMRADYEVTVYATQREREATELVMELGEKYDRIVCSGGDGTMNEVANGMMRLHEKPICGYIPAGTVNDFASSLRIPKIMRHAAELVTQGKVFRCDLGSFNDKFFTYVAGFGAFTEVSYTTPQEWKNMLGKTAYFIEGLKHLAEIKPHHMRITYDDGVVEDDFVLGLVSNSVSVAGYKAYQKEDIKMDDGLFEVTLIKKPKNPLELNEIIAALINAYDDTEMIDAFKANSLYIHGDEAISWTLDGEFGGEHKEVRIKNRKQALDILINS